MNTSKTTTDEELVKRYENGDDSAFDVLLERHQEKLYNYITFFIHDKETADDIFQETFVRAITFIRTHRYTHSGFFNAWLIRISHNLIGDIYRQQEAMPVVNHEFFNEQSEKQTDYFNDARFSDPDIETVMLRQQSIDELHQMLRLLPKNQQEIIRMRFFLGLSFKEISEELGVSINTALGRVRYGILNLRRMSRRKDFSMAV